MPAVIDRWMIYGAYGYTGRLVVEEAVRRGHQPILAGRDEKQLLDLAQEYRLGSRVFDLDHVHKARQALSDVGLVLNCAGPFALTAQPLREACLDCGVHYLDITGEMQILEDSYQCHQRARDAGVVVISGVGFDVVPTDLLSHRLKEALPDATDLELAFAGSGGISPGTAKTMLQMMPDGGKVRRDGEIVTVPVAWDSKEIEFADGRRFCMTIPWGDIVTAWYTTAIGNIRVYTAVEEKQVAWLRRLRFMLGCLEWGWLQKWLGKQIEKNIHGPDEKVRESGKMVLSGTVSNAEKSVTMYMQTPEGYRYTVMAALFAVESLLAHKVMPGAYTPSQALDINTLQNMEGVMLETVEN